MLVLITQRAQRQLFRILKKLDTFCSTDHFERKLALYTACKLIELSSSSNSCGQHEQTMQVRPITEYTQNMRDGNFHITGYFARTCAARSMEVIWLVVCEEMVLHGLFHQIMRQRIQQRASWCEDRTKLNR
jgi:hypothetical protein